MNSINVAQFTSDIILNAQTALDEINTVKDIYEREDRIILPVGFGEFLGMEDDCIDGKEREFIMKLVDKVIEGSEMVVKMSRQ